MKHKSLVLLNAIMLLTILYNGTMSQKTSTRGRGKPEVNCTGALIDINGNQASVIENITIAGLYKQIRVYLKPRNTKQKLIKHYAFLDPAELSSIKVVNIATYNDNSYAELEVTRKDGTVTTYLIESDRRIYYDLPTGSGHEEREIKIHDVDTLTFTECKTPKKENDDNDND